jgi:hypothetical protein
MSSIASTHAAELTSQATSQPGDSAPTSLHKWLAQATKLSFVYSRSLGGLLQTGRAVLSGLDTEYLELRAEETTMLVVIREATYSTEPQEFFNASLTASRLVAGVSISLANHDWLFLCPAQDQDLLVHGHLLPGG